MLNAAQKTERHPNPLPMEYRMSWEDDDEWKIPDTIRVITATVMIPFT